MIILHPSREGDIVVVQKNQMFLDTYGNTTVYRAWHFAPAAFEWKGNFEDFCMCSMVEINVRNLQFEPDKCRCHVPRSPLSRAAASE
jgi:hypothetical protein